MESQKVNVKDKGAMLKVAQVLMSFNSKEKSEELTKAVEYLCKKFGFSVIG